MLIEQMLFSQHVMVTLIGQNVEPVIFPTIEGIGGKLGKGMWQLTFSLTDFWPNAIVALFLRINQNLKQK